MNDAKKYTINGAKLSLAETNVRIEFPGIISDIILYNDLFIVLVEPNSNQILNENVFAVDKNGNRIWQVPATKHAVTDSPYTSIRLCGDVIKLFNWDCHEITVNPQTWEILTDRFLK